MTFDWQNATALLAAFTAGGYLIRRGWLALRHKRAGCGGCGNCASAAAAKTFVVIQLQPSSRPGK